MHFFLCLPPFLSPSLPSLFLRRIAVVRERANFFARRLSSPLLSLSLLRSIFSNNSALNHFFYAPPSLLSLLSLSSSTSVHSFQQKRRRLRQQRRRRQVSRLRHRPVRRGPPARKIAPGPPSADGLIWLFAATIHNTARGQQPGEEEATGGRSTARPTDRPTYRMSRRMAVKFTPLSTAPPPPEWNGRRWTAGDGASSIYMYTDRPLCRPPPPPS